jgi:hypothetical protein
MTRRVWTLGHENLGVVQVSKEKDAHLYHFTPSQTVVFLICPKKKFI